MNFPPSVLLFALFAAAAVLVLLSRQWSAAYSSPTEPETRKSDIPGPRPSASAEWEYDIFIYHLPPNKLRVRVEILGDPRGEASRETEAKRKFWDDSKDEIWMVLQTWLDKGWEPVGKVGASCIKIRNYDSTIENVMRILWGLLGGYSENSTYYEPVAFQLEMRRQKRNPTIPSTYTRQRAELEEAEDERRERESSFTYRLGRFIRKLLIR